MKSLRLRILFFAASAFLAMGTIPAFAQAPLEPAQLPSRTVFYLIWRGAPAPDVRKANALMALWDDADFAPVRSALASNILNSSQEKSTSQKLTPEELQEYASLLENGFTLGYIAEPAKRSAASAPVSKEAKPPAWNGMFFVYDRSGKESLIAKAILRMRAQQKEAPMLTPLAIGGVPVLKVDGKNGTTYWADQGKFAVSAGERSVMEQILGRLNGKTLATASLAQSSAYQEAQPILGGGILEFFVGIPDWKELASDSNAGGFKAGPLLEAARIDAIHSIGGHLALEGSKTHMQAAIFGNTAPGTPFDIWPSGPAIPVSLTFAPADAISYSAGQINFMGIYSIMKRIAQAAFPQGPQGNTDMLDTLAAARLGMPLADALSLPTGEFASMQTSPSLDTAKQVYFLGIRKKPETLKLMRALFSDQLTSERNEGDVTYLKISLGGRQASAGVAQWNFFNVAVTPDMMIGAKRAETLREVLENRAKGPAASGLATVPQFQASRAKFPDNLNSISYFDFQKVDWPGLRDRLVAESRKASAAKSLEPTKKPAGSGGMDLDWLTQVNAQVFSRHLHYSTGVSWKDSKGIHWDQWLE